MFLALILLEVLGVRHAVGESVEGWLPPRGPSCLPGVLGIQPAGDQVQVIREIVSLLMLAPYTSAKCAEIFPVVNPLAYNEIATLSTSVSGMKWSFSPK